MEKGDFYKVTIQAGQEEIEKLKTYRKRGNLYIVTESGVRELRKQVSLKDFLKLQNSL